MFKKILTLALALCVSSSAFALVGCSESSQNATEDTKTTTVETTTSVTENPLYKEIDACIQNMVMADKTNEMKYELKKYPDYFINGEYGGEKEFEKLVEENFYKCDTDYEIYSIEDVSAQYAQSVEKEINDYYGTSVNIDGVAKVEDGFRYYNYDSDQYVDQTEIVPSTEYYIKADGTWYYGWGIELNAEITELEQTME